MDYIDLDTGKTLTCEPGNSYSIAPASGHAVPDVPADDRFGEEIKPTRRGVTKQDTSTPEVKEK